MKGVLTDPLLAQCNIKPRAEVRSTVVDGFSRGHHVEITAGPHQGRHGVVIETVVRVQLTTAGGDGEGGESEEKDEGEPAASDGEIVEVDGGSGLRHIIQPTNVALAFADSAMRDEAFAGVFV